MPRTVTLKTNFVSGEFDPLLLARSDIKHYFNGAERLRNAVVIPQGGVGIRPGQRFVAKIPDIPPGDGGGLSNIRLASFQFNTEQTYLMVFHHKTISIYRDGVFQVDVVSPYTSDELTSSFTAKGDLITAGIYWTQSKDTMLIFHEGRQVHELKRAGSHILWTFAPFPLRNVPRFDFGEAYTLPDEIGIDEVQEIEFPNPGSQGDWTDGDTFVLILEDEESANIQFTSVADDMSDNIQAALRGMPNTGSGGINVVHDQVSPGVTTAAVFEVTFTTNDGERPWGSMFYRTVSSQQVPSIDIIVTTEGQLPGEQVWGAVRGFPRCGLFFQGRLWMAGTPSLPHYLWASRSGDPHDFNNKLFKDDYGIAVPADTSDVPAFVAIHAGRHLQIFSTSAEFYVPVSDRDGVTPSNIALRRTTSRGCKAGLRVFDVDGATHFIQRQGGALREFIFTDIEAAYQANNISLLSSHLVRDPVDFALRRSTSTEDADYEFLVNSDGTMAVFCTLRTQEVNAFTLWATDGEYRAAGVVIDDSYFAVKRTVDGVDGIYLELMDDDLTVDCGLSGGAAASATLAHLPNTLIEHVLDGAFQQPITSNGAGLVTFLRPSVEDYQAGLRFAEPDVDQPGMLWFAKTLPLELLLPEGATLGKKRRIVNLSMRLHETSAISVNGSRQPFRSFGTTLLDQRIVPFTGVRNIRGLLGWDFDGSVVIGSDQSLKARILGLSFAVSV